MILTRILRQHQFNWKYAFGEVALIFIGISLSLVFDEWRTGRSKKIVEQEHVALLVAAVQADIKNLDQVLVDSRLTLTRLEFLIKSLQGNSQFSDSVSVSFGYMVHNPQFEPDLSAIKNLESAGITIITNVELRNEIHYYYQRVENNLKWAAGVQAHIDSYLNPRVLTDFKDFLFITKGEPYDFHALRTDRLFLNALKRSQRLNLISVERIETQKQHAVKFLEKLLLYVDQ